MYACDENIKLAPLAYYHTIIFAAQILASGDSHFGGVSAATRASNDDVRGLVSLTALVAKLK